MGLNEGFCSFLEALAYGGHRIDHQSSFHATFQAFLASKDLDAMDALNHALDNISATLRTPALQHRNSLVLLHRMLPTELLAHIFCVATEGARVNLPITQVCSYWRRVALATPGVWNRIELGTERLRREALQVLLGRTKELPFEFIMPDSAVKRRAFFEFYDIQDLLEPHVHRLKVLTVPYVGAPENILISPTRPAPLLRHLVLGSRAYAPWTPEMFYYTPQLHSLEYCHGGDWGDIGHDWDIKHEIHLPPTLKSLAFVDLDTWDIPLDYILNCPQLDTVPHIRVRDCRTRGGFNESDLYAAAAILAHNREHADKPTWAHIRTDRDRYVVSIQTLHSAAFSRAIDIPRHPDDPELHLVLLLESSAVLHYPNLTRLRLDVYVWNDVAEALKLINPAEGLRHVVLDISRHIPSALELLRVPLWAPRVSVLELQRMPDEEFDVYGLRFPTMLIRISGAELVQALPCILDREWKSNWRLDHLIVGDGLHLDDEEFELHTMFKHITVPVAESVQKPR